MFLLILIPLILGFVLSRHWLQQDRWPEILGSSIALAFVFTLTGVNFFYRYQDLSHSVQYCLILQVLVGLGLVWRCPSARTPLPFSKWCRGILIALGLLVVVYCNAQQISNPDDDYWIHAPLQGLMRSGNFPPTNPFFSDIPMNGHYGRNLSIVAFSYLSGCDVFLSQHLLTSALQLVTLLLFFSAFHRCSESEPMALLATAFVFFGINAGGRGGLIDTMQNNNAFVHMYLALICYLSVRVWKQGRWTPSLLGGLTLGSYAIVYETHFGLVFLTILGLTPILYFRKITNRRQTLLGLLMLGLSLPLAFTQGGPLTDILDRKLNQREHNQAEQLSKGMQNQAQVVKIKVPKDELFQILLETGEYQRTSNIYRLDTPLKFLYKPSTDRGYAYIWSWDVLKIHFLPLYLLPWSVWVLWRRKSLSGLFMGAFGTIAFLVPALVHFGPIYESEYYRWEFAAALGFAASLGLTVGNLLANDDQSKTPKIPLKTWLLVGLLTLVNSWASLDLVSRRLQASLGPQVKRWALFPSTQSWLEEHRVLGFGRLDFEAASWLGTQVKTGDRLLTNFRDENNFSILYESTLTGISGARCVGHALPLEDEKIGTTPFRRSPAAQLFWQTGRADPLAQLQVDWLYYQTTDDGVPPEFPGATLVHRFKYGNDVRLIYSVDPEQLPKLELAELTATRIEEANWNEIPSSMRGGQVYELDLATQSSEDALLAGTLVLSTERMSDGLHSPPSENLHIRIEELARAGRELSITVPFVAPHDEGEYTLRAHFHPDADSPGLDIAEAKFQSNFRQLLSQTKIRELKFLSPENEKSLPRRTLLTPEAELELPPSLPSAREVLACWAFYSVERREFDLLPGINLRKVRLEKQLNNLPLLTPERPGEYRLSLYLSSGQGHLVRVLGRTVRVGSEPG